MALHLLRMAVKIESIAHLKQVQAERLREEQGNGGQFLYTFTRNIPKRADELLDGGSLFWVIKRYIRVRQPILGLERLQNDEGREFCAIRLEPEPIQVVSRRQKAFQGWRYFKPEDVPADLEVTSPQIDDLPPDMAEELRELGLL